MSDPEQVKVSVVVSTYGRLSYFQNLVGSVRSAFPPGTYEIVAVSSDPTDSPKCAWMAQQPDVVAIMADVRAPGTGRKRSLYAYENIGIKASSGKWVVVTNDDTTFEPDFYATLLEVEADYDVILVKGHVGEIGLGMRIPVIGTVTPPSGEVRPLHLYDFTIIRRTAYEAIGYLDENLDWFGKGADLALKCETHPGMRILRDSNLKIHHSIAEEGRQRPGYHRDFQYATDKWNNWCAANGWSTHWPW